MNKVSKNLELREITAPVLIPDEVDYHGHIYSEEEVIKACRNYQEKCKRASLQHRFDLSKDDAFFVEHYIAPTDMVFKEGDEEILVKKGAWMATMKVKNDTLWNKVKEGHFSGFSIQAICRSLKVEKAKVAGRAAAEEGVKVEKRLFDIDFSEVDHHVALVDEAANATKVLVVKAKHSPDDPVDKTGSPEDPASVNQNKETQMNLEEDLLKAKAQAEEVTKERDEVSKKNEELEAELETLRKEKEEKATIETELETLRKEKEEKEVQELISKSKDLKADEPEKFAVILQKCKSSLDVEEYEVLTKQLEKLKNIEDNKEILEDKGEGETAEEQLSKAKDKKFLELRKAHLDAGKDRREASRLARLELEKDSE